MRWQLLLPAAMAAASFILWWTQWRAASPLRDALAAERGRASELAQLRAENARLKAEAVSPALLESLRADHAAVNRLKSEIEDLEKIARERGVPDGNRDPTKGPVALNDLQYAGRQSPGAAFQTLMWAAFRGEDEILAGCVTMTATNRQEGYALIASLPVGERSKYPTPEKLWVLFMAPEMLRWTSVQVMEEKFHSPEQATVTIRPRGAPREEVKLPMQLGRGGWQAVVPEPHMRAIGAQLNKGPPPRP
jgi:hypothetical protein